MRSDNTLPQGPKRKYGAASRKAMMPSHAGECVSSQASQLTASVCTKKLSQEVSDASV